VIRDRGEYFQVRVYAGLDLLTGKKRFLDGRAPTKPEAEKLEARLTQAADGRHGGAGPRTVEELVHRWLAWRETIGELSPTTLVGYRHWIRRVIVPALGRVPVRRLDVGMLDQLDAELRRRGRKDGRPMSPSSIRDVHAVLSGSPERAVVWGWRSDNPARPPRDAAEGPQGHFGCASPVLTEGHPRGRGEHPMTGGATPSWLGPPPRPRGARQRPRQAERGQGTTSAIAGCTASRRS
jgi:hypothetical protein